MVSIETLRERPADCGMGESNRRPSAMIDICELFQLDTATCAGGAG